MPADRNLPRSGNPVVPGFYADPDAVVFGNRYWLYPTVSAPYEEQLYLDAFSSPDLIAWTKHGRVLDAKDVPWIWRALWAPCAVESGGRYFLFFSANDIQRDGDPGGIGVAVADAPSGPFCDWLGKPLIGSFHHGAQPIDQCVFTDDDGARYLLYGGWGHCNIARLRDDFTGFCPFPDGAVFREITPAGYVEGPFMLRRGGRYYFMWSEGKWSGPDYSVAWAVADSPFGPFERAGKILEPDPAVAFGAGHHSVVRPPGSDDYFVAYHRRPPGVTDLHHRIPCLDRMAFGPDGGILPVRMTREGVEARPLGVPDLRKT